MQKHGSIDAFLCSIDPDKRAQVDELRRVLLGYDGLIEHLKWNAPSYVWRGEDRITFNLMNKESLVKLVFHMGAVKKETKGGKPIMHDSTGLMVWNSDIRGTVSFRDLEDVLSKRSRLNLLIDKWLSVDC